MTMVRLIVMVCLYLSISCKIWAAGVQVQVNPETVSVGDDFSVTFSTDQTLAVTPDFSPLSKDFQVTSSSTSTNLQYINGQMTQQTVWTVGLFAKQAGRLQIPSIHFGQFSSEPTTIQVVEGSVDLNGKPNADILVELCAEPSNPYVQQQVIVTQRL